MSDSMQQRVAWTTVISLGLLLLPLTTMWHEIGGHALTCAASGGRVTAIGAYYVTCAGVTGTRMVAVAVAGAGLDAALAIICYMLWRRAHSDLLRLVLWYLWVGKGFVAAGYLCFSGVSGVGDLAPGADGIGMVAHPALWRVGELAIGIAVYGWLVSRGIATLIAMVGGGAQGAATRRRIAHGFYATAGVVAVLVGLLNPEGAVITIMSAAASSLGGLAGMISIGFARRTERKPRTFVVAAHWQILVAGVVAVIAFAVVLGPTLRFA